MFRVDAATFLGFGHVSRCINLAQVLKKRGHNIIFVSQVLPGDMIKWLKTQSFTVLSNIINLPNYEISQNSYLKWMSMNQMEDANQTIDKILLLSCKIDLLIIDHYALDIVWHQRLRPYVFKIMVIDDLPDRSHDCDVLLNQNLGTDLESYRKMIPSDCKTFLGPKYALLSDKFHLIREKSLRIRKEVKNILVSFGGSDWPNETLTCIKSIDSCNVNNFGVDIVVGKSNIYQEDIQAFCAKNPNFIFHLQTDKMPELIQKADFAFGAGGVSTWERLCLGLPAAVVTMAYNQQTIVEAVAHKRCIYKLGYIGQIKRQDYQEILNDISSNSQKIYQMSKNASMLVDGLGTSRVASEIETYN